jgi:CBS domain containing-hemolysin-like protein
VRRPSVEELAASGDRRARLVAQELGGLSYALSAAQFGITVTSLLVGYVAERTVGDTVIRPLLDLVGLPEQAALAVAVTGALLVSTIVQMVLGELFPKNLAISRPLEVARAVAPFSRGFAVLLGPVIRLFDGAARLFTERVLRVEVADELAGGHSLDELSRIIAASEQDGSLTVEQAALLSRAAELGDRRVTEVMVARPDVAWLSARRRPHGPAGRRSAYRAQPLPRPGHVRGRRARHGARQGPAPGARGAARHDLGRGGHGAGPRRTGE